MFFYNWFQKYFVIKVIKLVKANIRVKNSIDFSLTLKRANDTTVPLALLHYF